MRSLGWLAAHSSHYPIDFGRQRDDLAHRVRCGVDIEDETTGARGLGEGDTLADAGREDWRIVIGEACCGLPRDHGARRAAIEHEARHELRAKDSCFLQ